MKDLAEFRADGRDRQRLGSIQKVKCTGKTEQTMVVRRMPRLVGRCDRAAVGRVKAKLG